ncbi:hypothetical protein GCM10007907_32000 [Chitinimonas prasina]|uniref:Histidine kinase/HSP90-like ATPase domain-containing protein n=1 Tax=Chitinimonas prasina TaxID=1434937 RepID=A0ABQ5YM11_9NEIS|nr:histidine kinase [Chitinimonas prasina]GLR14410.1 hypothetical protein GCM10007907_32000 [Chitinimonas prasina]
MMWLGYGLAILLLTDLLIRTLPQRWEIWFDTNSGVSLGISLAIAVVAWLLWTRLLFPAWSGLPHDHRWRRRWAFVARAVGWLGVLLGGAHLISSFLLAADVVMNMPGEDLGVAEHAWIRRHRNEYWGFTTLLLAVWMAVAFGAWLAYRRFEGWRHLLSIVLFVVLIFFALFSAGFISAYTGRVLAKDPVNGIAKQAEARHEKPKLPIHTAYSLLLLAAVGVIGLSASARLRNRDDQLLISKWEAEALRERTGRELAEAQLKLLQAQIEPHFLFNTLGALQQRAEGKAPEAAALAADLVRFLRGSMQTLRAEQTTLQEEFGLVEAYLGVMQARLGARLRYRLDLPSSLAGQTLPSMMLLTLAENAIKHGIEPCSDGGEVSVQACSDGTKLTLCVVDTGAGVSDIPGTGVGLDNIRNRLRLLHGGEARLVLEQNTPRGFSACITLPVPAASGEMT